jgi:hypothetical protein
MVRDNRKGRNPVPEELDTVLNNLQLQALEKIQRFGWKLKFVRRPLFQEVMPVISNPHNTKFAVLECDGDINMQVSDILRSSDLSTQKRSVE